MRIKDLSLSDDDLQVGRIVLSRPVGRRAPQSRCRRQAPSRDPPQRPGPRRLQPALCSVAGAAAAAVAAASAAGAARAYWRPSNGEGAQCDLRLLIEPTRGVAFWWPTSPPPDSAAAAATPCLCVESRVVLWTGMRGVGTSTTTEETAELRPWGVMPPAGGGARVCPCALARAGRAATDEERKEEQEQGRQRADADVECELWQTKEGPAGSLATLKRVAQQRRQRRRRRRAGLMAAALAAAATGGRTRPSRRLAGGYSAPRGRDPSRSSTARSTS